MSNPVYGPTEQIRVAERDLVQVLPVFNPETKERFVLLEVQDRDGDTAIARLELGEATRISRMLDRAKVRALAIAPPLALVTEPSTSSEGSGSDAD